MGAARTTPAVLAALRKNAHMDVSADDVALYTGFSVAQVQSAINRLITRDGMPIKVVIKAQVWRYDPPKEDGATVVVDTLFEFVGRAAKGDTIVRGDTSGALFRVVEL